MNTRLIFAQNLRTIPASAEEQNLKFLILRTNMCNNVIPN